MDSRRGVIPSGWSDVLMRAVVAEVAGFSALVLKAHEWDPMQCAFDAAWVAGGVLILSGLLFLVGRRQHRASR